MPAKLAKKPAAKSSRRVTGTAGRSTPAPRVRATVTSAPTVAAQLPPVGRTRAEAAIRKFEAGIVARKEAAPTGTALPPGATHEIVGCKPDGSPILKRKRFSAA
jgi:hypothetical protein